MPPSIRTRGKELLQEIRNTVTEHLKETEQAASLLTAAVDTAIAESSTVPGVIETDPSLVQELVSSVTATSTASKPLEDALARIWSQRRSSKSTTVFETNHP